MKKCVILGIAASAAVFAAPISLSDAIAMAKANNSQIKAEKAKVDMAESGQSEARSRFMPQLSLTASVTKINDPIYIDLGEIQQGLSGLAGGLSTVGPAGVYSKAYIDAYNKAQAGYEQAYAGARAQGLSEAQANAFAQEKVGGTAQEIAQQTADKYAADSKQQLDAAKAKIDDADFRMKVQDDVFFNARLTAIWPIFTGLKIYSAYDAAKENVNAKKAAFDMAQNTILMDVATKYFTLRLAEELTVLRESTKKNLEEHLARSKKLEEGGQISKAERLRAEVALAEAENALEDSYRDQTLARLALASLLHTDTNITAITPVLAPEQTLAMEEFKQLAMDRHPGLRQLRTERKRSQDAVSAARADYFPTVALFAYKELYTRDLTLLEPDWAVGAKMQWDLFKGGETRSKVSNAKALDRSLSSMEEQTMDNIGLLVEKRWREMEHAKSRLESLKKTRELAEEAHRSQTLAYEAGLATGLDVVDAELALSRLQVADLKAHYDAVVAWLGLLEASGEVVNAGEMLKNVKPVEEKTAEVSKPEEPVAEPVAVPVASDSTNAAASPSTNVIANPEGVKQSTAADSAPADSAKAPETATPATPAN
ncbi:Outer membrane protein TolC [Fibrobacter sp. UWB15]|uniref:TolC family protein n=1 Tax=unclassified Fibrobacter TaxID=2634177 RepID=UPI000A0E38D9|nr:MULTISPECIES: TolC family protein [unclassified Fibrobacter]PWJ66290.1 outer membrane protein TolC [Fibrobacter sp. UWB6]SMG19691.1 Outer membrane protein TolC [Fibrobacter sp. UWB15]